jgi:crossover junction endodeoxyribonuclease RuvC
LRVLGVDPGSTTTGFGVVEARGNSLTLVEAGCVHAPDEELPERLVAIHRGLAEVIARSKPDTAAVESLFFAKNVRSAIALGHARGVALLAIAEGGLSLAEYSPAEVKRAVVGTGRAEKEQVAHMVRMLLGRAPQSARLDVTDALAVAICHAHTAAAKSKIAGGR